MKLTLRARRLLVVVAVLMTMWIANNMQICAGANEGVGGTCHELIP